ncbi:DUF1772 domain-containing protein [Streptomyces scabiei]|uniref:DUF1772 domain-containing protein n=1 Tax=Streptomyces scabiei TaxID=1930 RepID=UPI0038F72F99
MPAVPRSCALRDDASEHGETVHQQFRPPLGLLRRQPSRLPSLVLAGVWAVAGWEHRGTGLVVTAGALLLLSVIMSVLLLVPINDRSKTWTPDNRPADWKQQANRWDRLHYVQVGVITAALTALVAALA